VGTAQWGVNDVSPVTMRRQLELALEMGYQFVDASEIVNGTAPENSLAVTFDDGLKSVADNAEPILTDLGIPWSLFVVTDWLDGRHDFGEGVMMGWRDLEKLLKQRVNIGSHSVSHPNFSSIQRDQVAYELGESRQRIRDRLGIAADSFAIPMGTSRDWTEEATAVAHTVGYETVFAQSEARRSEGTVARTFITRFDGDRFFTAALQGKYDDWEEWT
jgi:peptidoglycan/xylan/chitin deacetylase (PgdA/CDA1 family)